MKMSELVFHMPYLTDKLWCMNDSGPECSWSVIRKTHCDHRLQVHRSWVRLLNILIFDSYCIVLYLNTCYSAPTRFPIQRRSRLLRGHWIGVSRRSAWAIASEGLAQGPYAAAWGGFEPATLQLQGTEHTPQTTAPQYIVLVCCIVLHIYIATEPPAVKIREINLW